MLKKQDQASKSGKSPEYVRKHLTNPTNMIAVHQGEIDLSKQ